MGILEEKFMEGSLLQSWMESGMLMNHSENDGVLSD